MSLATVIHAGIRSSGRASIALVLMGGGARTAYQVGVLRAVAAMLLEHPRGGARFPFQVLIGTSAGAINAAFLAAHAQQGGQAFEELARFWRQLRCSDVYRLDVPGWTRYSRLAAVLSLSRHIQKRGALLDNAPLAELLRRGISLEGLEGALRSNTIDALAVSASSYSSGVHWTFCQTANRATFQPWTHPGRRAEFQILGVEHWLASSAIPFLFPAGRLQVDGRDEHFGDGSMRQIAPLSPAMHLGARKILVIGVGQPERPSLVLGSEAVLPRGPTLGNMAGHVMASVFHDTLQADVEQTYRVSETFDRLPPEVASALHYKPIEVLTLAPSCSLDALAQQHTDELPVALRRALAALGMLKGSGGTLASYLLIEPGFVQSLIALGESDASARRGELMKLIVGD